jgi:hypothetical protein
VQPNLRDHPGVELTRGTVPERIGILKTDAHVIDEMLRVDAVVRRKVSFQLLQRFAKLTAGALEVAAGEMIETHGGLDHSLIEEPVSTRGLSPQLFPNIMRFKEPPGIEFLDAPPKKLFHWKKT